MRINAEGIHSGFQIYIAYVLVSWTAFVVLTVDFKIKPQGQPEISSRDQCTSPLCYLASYLLTNI